MSNIEVGVDLQTWVLQQDKKRTYYNQTGTNDDKQNTVAKYPGICDHYPLVLQM